MYKNTIILAIQLLILSLIVSASESSKNSCAEIERAFTEPESEKHICQCLVNPPSAGVVDSEKSGNQFWIGCTRQKMPAVFRSLFSLNGTLIKHLQIWDSLIPILPSEMFSKIRPEKLSIESSRVGVIRKEAFVNIGENLSELSLKNNILKSLDDETLANLTSITLLDLSGNKLTQLKPKHISTLTKLETLMLNGNQLSNLEDGFFQTLSRLKTLNLANNRLKRITKNTFKGLTNLETLNLRDNRIEWIDDDAFVHLKSLKFLDLWHNRVVKVQMRDNIQLERLILANNSIVNLADIKLQNLPSLTNLHLEDNKISTISDTDFTDLKQSRKLLTLTIDGNNISWIGCKAFEPIPNLVTLSLQRNKLTSLSCSSSRDPFALSVYLDHSVLEPLKSLRRILLSYNEIGAISDEDLSGLTSLQDLILDHNKISKMGRNSLNGLKLKKLFLNDNNLYYLPRRIFDGLDPAELQAVDISMNNWECICDQEWIGTWLAGLGSANTHSGTLGCLIGKCEKAQSNDELIYDADPEGHELWIRAAACVLAFVAILFLITAGYIYLQDARYSLPIRRFSSDTIRLIPSQDNLFSFPNPIGEEGAKTKSPAPLTVLPLTIHTMDGRIASKGVKKEAKRVRFN